MANNVNNIQSVCDKSMRFFMLTGFCGKEKHKLIKIVQSLNAQLMEDIESLEVN